jgi:hypothetical protein
MSTTHAYVIFFSGCAIWASAMLTAWFTWRLNRATIALADACADAMRTVDRVLGRRDRGGEPMGNSGD